MRVYIISLHIRSLKGPLISGPEWCKSEKFRAFTNPTREIKTIKFGTIYFRQTQFLQKTQIFLMQHCTVPQLFLGTTFLILYVSKS